MHVMEDTEGETIEDLSPSVKLRIVGFMHRNGTRAQKRFIASGKATKRGAGRAFGTMKRQIVEPYTTLKMTGCALVLFGLIAGSFIFTFYVALFALMATGSIMLCFLAAFTGALAYQLIITQPLAAIIRDYTEDAARYRLDNAWTSAGQSFGKTSYVGGLTNMGFAFGAANANPYPAG